MREAAPIVLLDSNNGELTLTWHSASGRWQAPLSDALSRVTDDQPWSVVYGDY